MEKLSFASDYMEGAHPELLRRLVETNLEKTPGYSADDYCEQAREKIRKACRCPGAAVHFLAGGTLTNALMVGALLRQYQGVVAADTGHISLHEAGAIEHGGHKVLTIPHENGKLTAAALRRYLRAFWSDGNREQMVMPGMVYLSQPTEYGTLYSLSELTAIRTVCDEYKLPLYCDGARLAYALACGENDVTLPDLARLCDAFYIGGTKCGALLGEAVVLPNSGLIPHFYTIMKQHGGLLAKGRLMGLQFDSLFTDDLYLRIGAPAIAAADRLREIFRSAGCSMAYDSPTNQLFPVIPDSDLQELAALVDYSFWEKQGEDHTVIRLAASWATRMEDVERLAALLKQGGNKK